MNYTEGAKVLDGWTITRKLGSGSFGTVYQIERKDEYGIYEQSALKVISVPQSPEDMREILNEGMNDREASTYFESMIHDIVREIAIMVAMKKCDHIVRHEAHKVVAHENGIGGDILIRMELLTPLTEYRLSHEMDEKSIIRMGKDLADALVYCEKKALIHRDIKPQNIFVTENGSFKLGDFGIARRMQQTTGASRKGTEDYMAPEVYLRRHYGTTVDIYSLGLVMYKYMNCGRLPFLPLPPTPPRFDEREQALQDRMNGVPLPPPAEAGEGLSAIILKACAYDSSQRYRSAGELKADLDALPVSGGGTISSTKNDVVGAGHTVHTVDEVSTKDIRHTVDDAEDKETQITEETIGGWPEIPLKIERVSEVESAIKLEGISNTNQEEEVPPVSQAVKSKEISDGQLGVTGKENDESEDGGTIGGWQLEGELNPKVIEKPEYEKKDDQPELTFYEQLRKEREKEKEAAERDYRERLRKAALEEGKKHKRFEEEDYYERLSRAALDEGQKYKRFEEEDYYETRRCEDKKHRAFDELLLHLLKR